LENYARTEALKQPIHIICGVKGSLGTFGKHHVNIPAYCWKKLIYRDSIQYYVMPNQDTVKLHPYTYYRVKI
jgi:DNA/RNA endonuclease G (NUC1)